MSDWAGQAAWSSNVRNAPLATVGLKKEACREGPGGDITLVHLPHKQQEFSNQLKL
jgi:hypothetical protein